MFTSYSSLFTDSFNVLWPVILNVGLRIIIAVVIFILGWIIGAFIESLISKIFKKVGVDGALRKAGLETVLHRGGVALNSGAFVGALVKWFVIIIFLLSSFQILGLSQVTYFIQQIVLGYLPQVIISVLILLVAVVIGDVTQKIVRASAGAANLKSSAALLGAVSKWVIWIFAVLTVLIQLGIGADLIRILFTGIVVAAAIAFGLAFGLGGQTHASQLIEKVKREIGGNN